MQSLLKELISKFGFPKLALVMKGTPAASSPPAVPSTRERVNLRSTRSVDPGSNRGELAQILYSNEILREINVAIWSRMFIFVDFNISKFYF